MAVYIYGLVDPRVAGIRRIRYVGKTVEPEVRLRNHIHYATSGKETNKRKAKWLNELLSFGLQPQIEVLLETSEERWAEDECAVIEQLRSNGVRLTNASAGGEGVNVPHTAEWHAKIGAARRGQKATEESRALMRESQQRRFADGCAKGHPWTEETSRIKIRADGGQRRTCLICRKEISRRAWERKPKKQPQPMRTHCKHGHPVTEENTYTSPQGQRYCRPCSVERGREYKARHRTVKAPKLTCKRGHPRTDETWIIRRRANGQTYGACRLCQQEWWKANGKRFYQAAQRKRQERRAHELPRTHCQKGHPYEGNDPIVTRRGIRRCRLCVTARRKLPVSHTGS